VKTELENLKALINTPEIDSFLRAVHIEAVHQVERWGTAHDRAKRPADWFWLVGYLGGKALHANTSGDTEKACTTRSAPPPRSTTGTARSRASMCGCVRVAVTSPRWLTVNSPVRHPRITNEQQV
jgi:hypothetical protein